MACLLTVHKYLDVTMFVCLSVCVFGTLVSPAKPTEVIEMPFVKGGGQTHVGLRDHILDWVQIPQERGTSKGNMCLTHLAQWARPVFAPAIV